jgi:preprotein translocase subunit SecF
MKRKFLIMQLYPLRLWSDNSRFDFISLGKFSYALSLILTLLSIAWVFMFKLNFGIDFMGGISIEIKSEPGIEIAALRKNLSNLNIGEVLIQSIGENEVSIKVSTQAAQDVDQVAENIKKELSGNFSNNNIEYRKVDFVGPQVGKQLIFSGAQSIIFAFLAIMVYVWIRFEWQFGLGVVLSLAHDAILCLGFMSLTQLDFNLSSIAAILTVIGYSVNDSVVIYDRIRENIRKYKQNTIPEIINISINETLSRTTLTVFTTLVANLALIIYGGEALRSFSILVFFGIVAGTYSSIFVSAPILTLLKLEKFK